MQAGKSSGSEISLPALGRTARLGQLFDARTGQFANESIFNVEDITNSPDSYSCVQASNTECSYSHDEDMSKRFDLLHIEADLRVGVLCNLVDISGSGKYLTEEKTSHRSVTSSLMVSVKTFEQSFQINNSDLKRLLVTSLSGAPTHYVGKIIWGGNSVVSVSYSNTERANKQDIEGALSAKLKNIAFSIEGKGRTEVTNDEKFDRTAFTFKFKSDSSIDVIPRSVEEAIEIMRNVPSELRKGNDGKGIQVEFVVYPIENLRSVLRIEAVADKITEALDIDCLNRITQYFAALESLNGRMNDLDQDFKGISNYVPEYKIKEFNRLKNNLNRALGRAKREISDAISNFRKGESDMEDVSAILDENICKNCSPEECNTQLDQVDEFFTQIQDVPKFIRQYNFIFIGKGGNWQKHCIDGEAFVLVFSWAAIVASSDSWLEANSMLVQLQKELQKNAKYILVDRDLTPFTISGDTKLKPIAICHYKDSTWKSVDVVGDRWKEQGTPTVKLKPGCNSNFVKNLPNDRVKVVLTCPKVECGGNCYRWKCDRCKEEIDYSESQMKFYCKCGLTPLEGFLYRCPCISHGLQFDAYDNSRLQSQLSKLNDNIIYIVLMGETGTGKSTFINSFANYLQFISLREGISSQDELITLIHNQYTLPNKNGENVTFSVGEVSEDETPQDGQSSTQKCKTYSFYIGNRIIKLIDTPGINDSRGIIQDKQNLENILAYLSYFNKIHAFLYLVPANMSRLTEQFRYCFKQLIARMHVSAADNIVFVYTKCRAALYTAGSSHGLMSTLCGEVERKSGVQITLNERTQYYVDNESLAILAGVKKGFIEVEPEKLKLFEASWEFSSTQCKMLFHHIVSDLTPHSINETLSLNKVRQIFGKLAQPIAIITQTIEKTIQNYKTQETQLKDESLTIEELNKNLMVEQTVVETIQLEEPRTVCADPKCCSKENRGKVDFNVYSKFCHDPCGLPPNPNLLNNVNIKQCHCFGCGSSETCNVCGHGWQNHMHVNVEFRPKKVMVASRLVQREVIDATNRKKVTENLLKENRKKQKSLENERDQLRTVAARLAVFLKTNSIIPYDDTVGNLIEKEIQIWEETFDKSPAQIDLLNKLIEMHRSYMQEVKSFEDASGENIGMNVSEAEELIKSLYELEFIGPQLKKTIVAQKKAQPQYEEITFSPPKTQSVGFFKGVITVIGTGIGRVSAGVYHTVSSGISQVF